MEENQNRQDIMSCCDPCYTPCCDRCNVLCCDPDYAYMSCINESE
ncbi:MAG TPA: hypothetical protein VGB37_03740 [Candidatus Lokiarchaeia archaeon]